jgi:hypothetical protein
MKPAGLLILACLFFLQTKAQTGYWQQQVDYTIAVELNDRDHTLDGQARITYTNHSPDTLRFIWFHCWPNAYKNDRSAFSDQTLENGSTRFYFSNADDRGYMNRLAFTVNGTLASMSDHPQHQEIVRVNLPAPLPPGKSCVLETPFHVKLSNHFSRGGHIGQSYQLTQWYPKAAVYDRAGWHPIPYLDQGEFYSDFGHYEVRITLPVKYTVAATGEATGTNDETENGLKTLTYRQENVIDFAWFADKRFVVRTDTAQLASGRVVKVATYSLPAANGKDYWKNGPAFIKHTLHTRGALLGEYPWNTATAVECEASYAGGMEYPTITLLSGMQSEQNVEGTIEHEVGHNWFYGILASNERLHPWMDEGMNTYYDNRYSILSAATPAKKTDPWQQLLDKRLPRSSYRFNLRNLAALKKEQAISTGSEQLSETQYNLQAYYHAAKWMKGLEDKLGRVVFDSAMRVYYAEWKFKHPSPADFRAVMERVSGQSLEEQFTLLDQQFTGRLPLLKSNAKRPLKWASLFSFYDTEKYRYLFVSPAAGYNLSDRLMLGAMIHNYTLPAERLQFLAAPMYGTGSKQWNGLARIDYQLFRKAKGEGLQLMLAAASFSGDRFTDSTGKNNPLHFSKLSAGVRYTFPQRNPRSELHRYIQFKTFYFAEEQLRFERDTINQADIISYPVNTRYLNQLQAVMENRRVLYPWRLEVQAEQAKDFIRLAVTGDYYFNYAKGGGMQVRVFAGKFIYLGEQTFSKQFATDAFHLNMTGPRGYEDYTYSNYFLGRNAFNGMAAQQLMRRDGFFKVGTDLLSSKVGKSDNWLAAANFCTDIPKSINPLQVLPVKIPLKLFVDIGTYAEAWKSGSEQGKLLYDAGLQLSLLKNTVNIYVPLFYSKVYGDYFKSTVTGNRFLKNISFSIDVQRFRLEKLFPSFAF